MNKHTISRVGAVAVLGAGMLLAPALTANAVQPGGSPVVAETAAGGACTVTGGNLTWGLKETFRSYIKSSIAKGDWETLEGASYELPNFVWSNPTGEFKPETGEGTVAFEGVLHFTGHGGVLDMWLGNPTFEFGADGKLSLFFDARSNDTDGNPKVEVTQEYFGDLGTVEPVTLTEGATTTSTYEAVHTILTAEGVPAFGDFYVEGDVLDPVTLSVDVACETPVAEAPTEEPEEPADAGETEEQPADEPAEAEGGNNWLLVGIIAGALALGAIAGAVIAAVKRKSATQSGHNGNA